MYNIVVKVAATILRERFFTTEHIEELEGCANAIGGGSIVDFILVANFMYDAEAHCTSIVLRQKDGNLLHARNLDYGPTKLFRNSLINVDFWKNGNLLYKIATITGFGGTITGIRPGAFSVSIDERDEGTLWDNLWTMIEGHTGNTFAMRYALENFDNYADAVEYFRTVNLVAPCYYIVGGVSGNDGSVITRARSSLVDFWSLDDSRWWLVQTNYDHWTNPGPNEIKRRVVTE